MPSELITNGIRLTGDHISENPEEKDSQIATTDITKTIH